MGDPARRNVILDWLFGAPVPGADGDLPPASQSAAGDRAFQPFGYRFEVRSWLPPEQVKAALRSRMKDWFDAQPGARGWIVGPFLCLWLSAFNRRGPRVLATVGRGDLGARVTGRAGSDLNGLVAHALLTPVLAFCLYQIVAAGDYTLRTVLLIGGVLALSPLVFWGSHKGRHEADPLVRFVQDAVARAEGRAPAPSAGLASSMRLTLTTGGAVRVGPTAEAIHDALLTLGDGEVVILSAAGETYIQAVFANGGYLLERRDGGPEAHFRAVRADDPSTATFTFEAADEAFAAWAGETPTCDGLVWAPVRLCRSPEAATADDEGALASGADRPAAPSTGSGPA